MRIGIVGAGRIGGNAARLLAGAGHELLLSFARDHETATSGRRLRRGGPRARGARVRRHDAIV
jgi:predicted dinucleotide-binding enzyme